MPTKEEQFHLSRAMFAILPSGEFVSLNSDARGHKEWLAKDYGISDEQFETIVRGYVKGSQIIGYKGSDFKHDQEVVDAMTLHLKDIIRLLPPITTVVNLYSGVTVGEVGEEWQPQHLIDTLEIKVSYK